MLFRSRGRGEAGETYKDMMTSAVRALYIWHTRTPSEFPHFVVVQVRIVVWPRAFRRVPMAKAQRKVRMPPSVMMMKRGLRPRQQRRREVRRALMIVATAWGVVKSDICFFCLKGGGGYRRTARSRTMNSHGML